MGGIYSTVLGTLFATNFGDPFGPPLVIILMVFCSLTITIVTSIWYTKNYRRKRDSVLILLPDGVVSCEYLSDEEKRSYNVIEYANVSHINVSAEITQYREHILLSLTVSGLQIGKMAYR